MRDSDSSYKKYIAVRKRSTDFVRPLKDDDFMLQTEVFVSPIKWHLGHTTWFFEEFILKNIKAYILFNERFAFLFNSYYNGVGERIARDKRGMISRPNVKEVLDYRVYVDDAMSHLIGELNSEQLGLLEAGLNHEEQHQELMITDLKYCLFQNPLYPVYQNLGDLISKSISGESSWIEVSEGVYEIGFEGDGFSFDNERQKHRQFVEAFAIRNELVSNKEFIEFVHDDGYKRHELWLDEGWAWAQEKEHPLYWVAHSDGMKQFTMGGLKELNPDAPISHINFYEADAFARWSGHRLATEFEWEVASDLFSWGERWEWTNSSYLPYPGFSIVEGAVGEYNGKFMINQMVLRGASVATSQGHSRKTYRNFFHPQYSWQYTGIRLAKSI